MISQSNNYFSVKCKLTTTNVIITLLILSSFLFMCKDKDSSSLKKPDIHIAKEKIILFTIPDFNSPKVKEFEIKKPFKIIEFSTQLAKFENKIAPWVKIQSGDLIGWAFGYYIPIELKEDLLIKNRFDDDEKNEYV
ncbi:MAG TPA: hypothetical protein PK079_21680 [Leptospiraceae bacterium]|nr:hypothetical protein [Leptospiraceae bacterium]HMW08092.1 hypothetical protein [Leptospiraceae bacterium]HMX34855.1 hypothetical protein [Leptospiraceae bacterium]HMY33803.1 hypothetical protein [Leptospiraceae bacterium]HMZ65914.1 hypothetical protein [Leptospiraceae bacterium]